MTGFEFSVDWFDAHIPVWKEIFKTYLPDAKRILEIGSFEGRSTVWMVENAFKSGGEIFCIDTWFPNPAHRPGTEARYDSNIALARARKPEVTVHKIKARSLAGMSDLLARGNLGTFDMVYVDAAHDAVSVLTDLTLAYHLCRVGGMIICDDYLFEWGCTEIYSDVPKPAYDAVVNILHGRVKILIGAPLYQLYLLKVK